MRFDVVTIFPELFEPVFRQGVVGRGIQRGLVEVQAHDLRAFTHDRHRQVDDVPFGGGPGMVLKPEPVFEAVERLRRENPGPVILLEPWGERLTQSLAEELAGQPGLIIVCGRYEGVDDRVRQGLADREVSIGDYVLSRRPPSRATWVVRPLRGGARSWVRYGCGARRAGSASAPGVRHRAQLPQPRRRVGHEGPRGVAQRQPRQDPRLAPPGSPAAALGAYKIQQGDMR